MQSIGFHLLSILEFGDINVIFCTTCSSLLVFFCFRHELENQQSKAEELVQKNFQLVKEIQTLQIQHQTVQNDLQLTIQSLEQSLAKERKFKNIAEDECLQKNNVKNLQR